MTQTSSGLQSKIQNPKSRVALLVLLLALLSPEVSAAPLHVIICGSGGEPQYTQQFRDWGTRLRDYLVAQSQPDPARVTLLTESPAGDGSTVSNLEGIRAAFQQLAQSTRSEDDLFVYLIGHGSYRGNLSKLNIPGPDLAAEDLDALIDAIPVRRCAVINGSSSSAGFINVLSAPNRVVCTATRSADERNATKFMGFLVEALESGAADADRDERVSLLEACSQAAVLTAAHYEQAGLIPSEHPLLDDNGDGLGTRLPLDVEPAAQESVEGDLARALLIKDLQFPPSVPESLIAAYRDALAAVEQFREQKSRLPEADYYAQLKALLLGAARANRAIQQAAQASPPP